MEALPVQHSLDVQKVEDLSRGARTIAEDVRSTVHGVAYSTRLRYLELAVAWTFLLFAAAVAYLYRSRLRRAREVQSAEAGTD